MRSEISIKHSNYMMTIKEVIEAIETASDVKVIKITVADDVLTFHVEEIEVEEEKPSYGMCPNCGRVTELNEEGYCFNIRCPD